MILSWPQTRWPAISKVGAPQIPRAIASCVLRVRVAFASPVQDAMSFSPANPFSLSTSASTAGSEMFLLNFQAARSAGRQRVKQAKGLTDDGDGLGLEDRDTEGGHRADGEHVGPGRAERRNRRVLLAVHSGPVLRPVREIERAVRLLGGVLTRSREHRCPNLAEERAEEEGLVDDLEARSRIPLQTLELGPSEVAPRT